MDPIETSAVEIACNPQCSMSVEMIEAILRKHISPSEAGGELPVITRAKALLETIVCTVPPDDGVVLLSNDGPTHYDAEQKREVYDHEHFSPLGDALIELHDLLSRAIAASPAASSPPKMEE